MVKKKLSNPGGTDLFIRDCREKALQRAMLKQSLDGTKTYLDDGTFIEWLDLELPVELSKNSRRKCIDLVGRDNNGRFVLCELKHSCNRNDSPHDAETEGLTYLGQICFHCEELDDNNIHHPYVYIRETTNKYDLPNFLWYDFIKSHPRFLIMADKDYWDYWKARKARQKTKITDKKVIGIHDSSIECFSLDIEPDYFKEQLKHSGDSNYVPELYEQNHWSKEII